MTPFRFHSTTHHVLRLTLAAVLSIFAASPAAAVDHNNLDAHRPLSFDDADSIAFREQSLEFGTSLGWPRRRPLRLGLSAEYLYGFALNSHVSLGLEPRIGGRSDDGSTAFDFGDLSLGLFHSFNREHGDTPAFALRGDLFAPTGRGSQGAGFRLRSIASRHAGQYGRLHLNLDLAGNPGATRGDRQFVPGLVVGYSRPLGYPTRFDTTGLAELVVRGGERRGTGGTVGLGLGVRRQVGVRSVLDLGIQSDIVGWNAAPRDRVRLVGGFSYGF